MNSIFLLQKFLGPKNAILRAKNVSVQTPDPIYGYGKMLEIYTSLKMLRHLVKTIA